jgi:hypothetical protein
LAEEVGGGGGGRRRWRRGGVFSFIDLPFVVVARTRQLAFGSPALSIQMRKCT